MLKVETHDAHIRCFEVLIKRRKHQAITSTHAKAKFTVNNIKKNMLKFCNQLEWIIK
jgi:hypothetical protein